MRVRVGPSRSFGGRRRPYCASKPPPGDPEAAQRQCGSASLPRAPMKRDLLPSLALAALLLSCAAPPSPDRRAIDRVDTVVVIYAENRAFDTFYGLFPGANGI